MCLPNFHKMCKYCLVIFAHEILWKLGSGTFWLGTGHSAGYGDIVGRDIGAVAKELAKWLGNTELERTPPLLWASESSHLQFLLPALTLSKRNLLRVTHPLLCYSARWQGSRLNL
jgi:hypothetical protein